jgi:hypothetical protein
VEKTSLDAVLKPALDLALDLALPDEVLFPADVHVLVDKSTVELAGFRAALCGVSGHYFSSPPAYFNSNGPDMKQPHASPCPLANRQSVISRLPSRR